MKKAPIYMKDWLQANRRTRIYPSDKWYLDFAIRVLPVIKQSPLFANSGNGVQVKAALAASLYLQDVIAQEGDWKSFTQAYHDRYGSYLPFYNTQTEGYIPDEINREDLALIYWAFQSGPQFAPKYILLLWPTINKDYSFLNPLDKELLALSSKLYDMMDAVFEEAPICEEPTTVWFMFNAPLETPSEPLPIITPETHLTEDVQRCLAYSKGHPLLYFADYKALCDFLINVLGWEKEDCLPELEKETEFVIYANAKGMLIAYNVAAYFCDERNPLYNARRATDEGYQMFVLPSICPFDLLKYGMTQGLLPDVQFPFPRGKEVLQQNWDFITLYYLKDYYEGK
ncbi:MAG: DUF3843 family protein [Bacteroides sp.]|nr:DUF3843 family protein [Bacteroides sp.]